MPEAELLACRTGLRGISELRDEEPAQGPAQAIVQAVAVDGRIDRGRIKRVAVIEAACAT